MIEDKELRDLFKIECDEHLQTLEDGLLYLEKNPDDKEKLHAIFRDAHSLKGASRMLGISDIESISHVIEDILGKADRGTAVLTSEIVDRIYEAIDSVRKLVIEAVTGLPAEVDVIRIVEILTGERKFQRQQGSEVRISKPPDVSLIVEVEKQPLAIIEDLSQAGESKEKKSNFPDQQEKFRVETMRVEPSKLDQLMAQSGELTVAKLRVSRRVSELENTISMWDEFSRESGEKRKASGERRRNDREKEKEEKFGHLLGKLKLDLSQDSAKLDMIANRIEDGIRKIRMVPLSTVFSLFNRTVRDLARDEGKNVQLIIEGGETTADKQLIEEMKDPLMHMIRNAMDHGIENPADRERTGKPPIASIFLRGRQTGRNIIIEVADDGGGIDRDSIRRNAIKKNLKTEKELSEMDNSEIYSLIFLSGFSTKGVITDVSGRGIGMDVVKNTIENLKGSIRIRSEKDKGTTFEVRLPLSFATTRVLIISEDQKRYAIPEEFVELSQMIPAADIFLMEDKTTCLLNGKPVSIVRLRDFLDIKNAPATDLSAGSNVYSCIFINIEGKKLGIIVDALIDEQEVIMKPFGGILRRIRCVSGACILESGDVCIVLNPKDILNTVLGKRVNSVIAEEKPQRKKVILLAEDSMTTRMQEKRILESAGYEVVAAVDGKDAYSKFYSGEFDAIVSDIEMPNMDGFTLTSKIREDKKFIDLPIVLVTTLSSPENIRKGMEAGANAYITKSSFDQTKLLETLKRLI